ncbi:hypothetical protein ACFYY5_29290 [Nocardia elegans]|uniref:4Fe-4S Wbl-type domain-containing protein n=1 Tax=Nocardia elegans TaxID=300029 RepID=A0ABW6TNY6_9NOCA
MTGTWRFGDGNPFAGAPCTSELSKQWQKAHRGASQWDYQVDRESESARRQRLLRAQRLCGDCGAKLACLGIRSELVREYNHPVAGVWGGRIFGDGQEKRPDTAQQALMPREDMAA